MKVQLFVKLRCSIVKSFVTFYQIEQILECETKRAILFFFWLFWFGTYSLWTVLLFESIIDWTRWDWIRVGCLLSRSSGTIWSLNTIWGVFIVHAVWFQFIARIDRDLNFVFSFYFIFIVINNFLNTLINWYSWNQHIFRQNRG